MSKVSREETAINSADVELVTAMKSKIRIRTAPPLPRRAMAVAGAERPASTCALVSAFGYVGKRGSPVNAAQPRPMTVAKPKGIPDSLADIYWYIK